MTVRLELSCLGHVEIKRDGQPVEGFVSAKAQALLIYLAVTGQPHSRETLAGLLWGDKPENRARANLRKALSNLRRLVSEYVSTADQTVGFNRAETYSLDVTAFESALTAGDTTPPDLSVLQEAVELYRGDFLAGFSVEGALPFEEWVLAERERLRRMAIEALHQLGEAYTARGEYETGIEITNRLLTLEPWQEEAHRQLMALLVHSGQHEAALAQYETCRRILAEELGVEPLPETQALYNRIKSGRGETPHNLPIQITPFIGRQTELAQIIHRLDQSTCRLLTIVGPGGIGKTRLAIKAAEQLLGNFADGVYFISLVGVHMPEFITSAIAEAIDCSLSGKAPAETQLLNHLQDKDLLLVIDNFEHLLSLAGSINLLTQILQVASKVKVLVTSRERLNLQAEWLFTLLGLEYPPDETTSTEVSFEAVDLFVQCARRVQPNFVQSVDKPAIARICRLLDGMPLAIELAAVWVQVMPCAEIAEELTSSFDLLTTSLHDVPDRHKSLQTVFDYSWQRLSEPEQSVFKQLSVFAGEFGRQVAQQVAGASLSMLAALVNNSLLRAELSGRYSMLEPLKQYAALRLAESVTPTSSEIQERHARYYLCFLQAREKQLQGEVQPQTMAEINAAFKDIQVAWRWAVDHNQFDLVGQVGKSLFLFCDIQSRFQTGDTLFKYAISPLETLPETENLLEYRVLGKLLACRGRLLYGRGEYQTARKMLEKSLRICCACDHPGWATFILHSLGLMAVAQGEGQQAKQFAQESLNLCQNLDSPWDEAWALYVLGLAAYFLGEYAPGQQFAQQSLALHRQLGNRHGEAACLNTLGLIICGRYEAGLYEGETDKYGEAREFFEQNLVIRRAIGDRWGEGTALHNLGYIHFRLQQYDQARARFEASLKISQMIDSLEGMAATGMWMGMLALEQKNFLEARRHLTEALKIAYENDAMTRLTDVLYRIGDLLQRTSQPTAAVEYLTFVHYHPATDDRVRKETEEHLVKLAAVLPSEILGSAQARGRAHTLEELVANVLTQPEGVF